MVTLYKTKPACVLSHLKINLLLKPKQESKTHRTWVCFNPDSTLRTLKRFSTELVGDPLSFTVHQTDHQRMWPPSKTFSRVLSYHLLEDWTGVAFMFAHRWVSQDYCRVFTLWDKVLWSDCCCHLMLCKSNWLATKDGSTCYWISTKWLTARGFGTAAINEFIDSCRNVLFHMTVWIYTMHKKISAYLRAYWWYLQFQT